MFPVPISMPSMARSIPQRVVKTADRVDTVGGSWVGGTEFRRQRYDSHRLLARRRAERRLPSRVGSKGQLGESAQPATVSPSHAHPTRVASRFNDHRGHIEFVLLRVGGLASLARRTPP